MTGLILKSQYQITSDFTEHLLYFDADGHCLDRAADVWVRQYKTEYIPTKMIKVLITQAEKLVHFRHANCRGLVDYEYDGNHFYTVHLRREDEIPLLQYLSESKQVSDTQIYKWSQELMAVLIALENQQLVCGSINLSQIMVSRSGQLVVTSPTIPITVLKRVINRFEVVDNCVFLPPELFTRKQFTIQSDMFSLGVLLHFLYASSWPFQQTNYVPDYKRGLLTHPKLLSELRSDLKPSVVEHVRRCLELDPDRRYLSAQQMAYAAVSGQSKSADPPVSRSTVHQQLIHDLKSWSWQKTMTRARTLLIVAGTLTAMAIGIIGYNAYLTGIPETTVPNLLGLSIDEAQATLKRFDLKGEIAGERVSRKIEAGQILETKPAAGRAVKQNRPIRLFVSKGRPQVSVPNMVGRKADWAMSFMDQKGFEHVVTASAYSHEFDRGVIIQQIPTPNTVVASDHPIELILSNGYPVELSVRPDLIQFFETDPISRVVDVFFQILPGWKPQEIKINYTLQGSTEILLNQWFYPGDQIVEAYEVVEGGRFSVYYNEELAAEVWVKSAPNNTP